MFSLSLSFNFFFQTYKNIIFWYRCIWQLFVLNSLFHDFGSFFIDGESCIGIYPPSLSLLSLSPSLSHIFLYFFIFGFFLINWRIDDIYNTHGCNTCMPAGLVAEFFFYWSLEKRINYHIHKYIYIWGLQFRSGICSANVLGGKIGNFVRVDIIINMQT